MRARRRDREHVAGNGNGDGDAAGNRNRHNRGSTGKHAGGGGAKHGKANRKRSRNRNRPPKGSQAPAGAGFWGDAEKLPSPTRDVRITDDPAAVARSLGSPPLPGHEKIAEHYFTVVYERAVQTAGALAAAGGLIDPETLTAEMGD